jgi:flagellin-like hook-associated protein FlgL
MTVTTVSTRSTLNAQALTSLRAQLNDLQRQLGTGQKSTDYAGLGPNRGLAVALQSQLSALSGFDDTIDQVGVRLDVGQSVLNRISTLGNQVKSSATTASADLTGTGQTVAQTSAADSLNELFSLVNTQAGNRYLFSGRATDTPAAASLDQVLNGSGARAGFKQVMSERSQADLGADGLGRLATARAGGLVSVSEDVAGSPFGFKLTSIGSNVTGATVSAPAGSPPSESVDFTGSSPAAGDTVTLQFALPDGTSESLSLTATTSTTPGANQFTIGATADDTATNFKTALDTAIGNLAQTSLRAASGMAAANDFFNIDAGNPPQRVDGPPFATATALVDGTDTNTMTWYTGDDATDAARTTAVARVDPSLSVVYGMRANEQGIRSIIETAAVFANTTFSPSDPNAPAAYAALQQRVVSVLGGTPGQQQVTDIAAELGGAQATLGAAQDRHAQTEATLTDLLQNIESAPPEEVGANILALQTNLQASLQTTALLARTTILDYI